MVSPRVGESALGAPTELFRCRLERAPYVGGWDSHSFHRRPLIAYVSSESERQELYVREFIITAAGVPSVGARRQITNGGILHYRGAVTPGRRRFIPFRPNVPVKTGSGQSPDAPSAAAFAVDITTMPA